MCFSTKAKVVFCLCAFMYKYNLLRGGVFCPCVNLQCIILFAYVSLSTPYVFTASIPVFLHGRYFAQDSFMLSLW